MSEINDAQRVFQYDEVELRSIAKAIRKMGDVAVDQARIITSDLTEFAVKEIKAAASSGIRSKQMSRIADGIRISKTSVIGEFSMGFASQKFSGGATTQLNQGNAGGNGILAGVEFGAKYLRRFPPRTPKFGIKGNEGYFIWPTLRRIQPNIIEQWEKKFALLVSEWDK